MVGPETRRSRLEKRRNETRSSQSRLVSLLCLARPSQKIFLVSIQKSALKMAKNQCEKDVYVLCLESRLVSWPLVSRQTDTRPSQSRLVSWVAVSVSSHLVTFVSLPALTEGRLGVDMVHGGGIHTKEGEGGMVLLWLTAWRLRRELGVHGERCQVCGDEVVCTSAKIA